MKNKWKPGDPPLYMQDPQLWTDGDLFKFAMIAFITGFILGVII
jgi:hypothetical protein